MNRALLGGLSALLFPFAAHAAAVAASWASKRQSSAEMTPSRARFTGCACGFACYERFELPLGGG